MKKILIGVNQEKNQMKNDGFEYVGLFETQPVSQH